MGVGVSTCRAWTFGLNFRGPGFMHCSYPRDQNSPKALYSMVFGPNSLKI